MSHPPKHCFFLTSSDLSGFEKESPGKGCDGETLARPGVSFATCTTVPFPNPALTTHEIATTNQRGPFQSVACLCYTAIPKGEGVKISKGFAFLRLSFFPSCLSPPTLRLWWSQGVGPWNQFHQTGSLSCLGGRDKRFGQPPPPLIHLPASAPAPVWLQNCQIHWWSHPITHLSVAPTRPVSPGRIQTSAGPVHRSPPTPSHLPFSPHRRSKIPEKK